MNHPFLPLCKNYLQLIFGIILLLSVSAGAKERKWEQALTGSSIVPGVTLTIQDQELSQTNYTMASSLTFFEVTVDDFIGPFYWYDYILKVQVKPILNDGTFGAPYDVELYVENNRYGNSGNFIDLQKHLIDGRGAEIKILNVTTNNRDTNTSSSDTPSNIRITLSYESERYYQFDTSLTPTISQTTDQLSNELVLNWQEIFGAEEYELAWTWVDNYHPTLFNTQLLPSIVSMTTREFELNCTRIQTNQLNYRIPLVYDNGYLVFRVRAIGRFWDTNYSVKKYGRWDVNPLQTNAKVANWGTNFFETSVSVNPLNWQFQSSYAEQGKKKEVMSFFDGSLRNRQTVTKINTTDKVIIGEVIYDEEGRPAVEVLPVPVDDKAITYYPDFNRNISEDVYSYQDFVSNDSLVCDLVAVGMSPVVKGASKYYSSNNAAENNFQDFVPDAEKYPFSQIKYTLDNTGRIKSKGGVGITHQLGSGHEMKYLYSVPSQGELNRLFGYSVGHASHYKKNYVIDPNKQISVSYIDPQGRTIATALSSDNHGYLASLKDEQSTELHDNVHEDLLNKLDAQATDTPLDNNTIYSTGYYGNLADGLRYDAQKIFVNEGTEYNFRYSINKEHPFQYECGNLVFNYPFVYQLTNTIVDDCGNYYKNLTDYSIGELTLTSEGNVVLVSAEEGIEYEDEFILTLPVNAYGITKTLDVDGEKLDIMANDYIRRGVEEGCILGPLEGEPNLVGCFYTCEECEEHYETLVYTNNQGQTFAQGEASFVAEKLDSDVLYLSLDENDEDYAQTVAMIVERYENEYDQIIKACKAPCLSDGFGVGGATTSMTCENALSDLLNDMLPSGQYGIYPSDVNGEGYIVQNAPVVVEQLELTVYNDDPTVNKVFSVVAGIDPENVNWRNPHYFDKDGFLDALYPQPAVIPNHEYKHYRTLDGQIDYVLVRWNEETGSFRPPLLESYATNPDAFTNPINIIDNEAGLYQVEPQYLANVEDFITEISSRDHWVLSLVKYHPEFHYLDYVWKQCKITHNASFTDTVTLNSDGLDAYIGSFETFEAAQAAGLLEGALTLFNNDPFFLSEHPLDATVVDATDIGEDGVEVTTSTSITSADFRMRKRSIMWNALQDTNDQTHFPANNNPGRFEDTGEILVKYIYKTIRCNGLEGPNTCYPPLNNVTTFEDVMTAINNNFSEDEKDLFWRYYVSYYIGLKQKIQDVFLQMHAARQGFYNDVIGNNNSWNVNKIKEVLAKYPSHKNIINGWISGDIPNPNIKSKNGLLLKDKVKRFLPYDETYESEQSDEYIYDQMQQDAAAYFMSITGNCPIINDLGIFIDNLTKATTIGLNGSTPVSSVDFFSPTTPSTTNITFVGGYLTPALFTAMTGTVPPVAGQWNVSSSHIGTHTITIQFNQNNTPLHPIELTLPSSPGWVSWSNYDNSTNATSGWKIMQVSNFSHTQTIGSDYYFSFVARVHNNADINLNSFVEVVITGKTPIILTCTTDGTGGTGGVVDVNPGNGINCTKKEDFANALKDLIIDLQASGNINNSDFDLYAYLPFTQSYLYEFFGLNEDVLTVRWVKESSGVYKIKIATEITPTISAVTRMTLNLDLSNSIYNLNIGNLINSSSNSVYSSNVSGPISGTISGTYIDGNFRDALIFDCCKVRDSNTTLSDVSYLQFLDDYKNVINEILEYLSYNGFENSVYDGVSYTFDYQMNSNNFLQLATYFNQPIIYENQFQVTLLGDGTYRIYLLYGTAISGSAETMTIYVNNFDDRVESIVFNDYIFNQYLNTTSDQFSLGANGVLNLINGTSTAINLGIKHLKSFYNLPTCPCTPQPIAAISCTEKYTLYVTSLANGTLPTDSTAGIMDEDLFCRQNYAYILDGYLYYIDKFDITTANYSTHPQYISFGQFGATGLNFGYNDYAGMIDQYYDYINYGTYFVGEYSYPQYLFAGHYFNETSNDEIDYVTVESWYDFIKMVLSKSNICPPYPMTPTKGENIPMDNPCVDFGTSVYETYNSEAYAAYIQALKDRFKKEYLKQALKDVVEQYTVDFFDKEYQYTLYYYDQAGNLIQTVAPQGVERVSTGLNSAINTYRQQQPQPVEEPVALMPIHDFKTQYRYNSLNQLVWQRTPDGGETRFAYDPLGRIIASQNDKQKNGTPIARLHFDYESYISYNSAENIYFKSINDNVWKYSGGFSGEGIIDNGFVEHTIRIDENNLLSETEQLMVGLSHSNFSGINNMLNYGFYYKNNGNFVVRIGNTDIGPDYTVSNGDKMKISREGDLIKLYQNGNLLYQLNDIFPNEMLFVDFGIHNYNSKIHDLRVVNTGTPKFSYTKYDALGRIFEAGEMEILAELNLIHIDDNGKLINPLQTGNNYSDTWVAVNAVDELCLYPHNISKVQYEVTRTLYDDYEPFIADAYLTSQPVRNVRNRVTAILTYDYRTFNRPLNEFETAIFYNYDIHGNVEEMAQVLSPDVLFDENQPTGIIKSVNYEYDLISGNVNKVIYQKKRKDQFIHRYQYDADNRITSVETSKDGYIWERDAEYLYYDHGPLARVIVGDKKVQGQDYAYTLQGWLKTVNSENLALSTNDMGRDGNYVSKDAYGFSLSYFNGDYQPRNPGSNTAHHLTTTLNSPINSLYNGNIPGMITSVRNVKEVILPTQTNLYSYDQLNRIVSMRSFTSIYDEGNYTNDDSYSSTYSYDRNGNLQTLKRSAPLLNPQTGVETFPLMDDFSYNYLPHTNKLTHVNDTVLDNVFGNEDDDFKIRDIDNQNANNYVYDEIGQLIRDEAEGITNIEWRVDGKVKSITKLGLEQQLMFYYDGLGNRVVKKVNNGRRGGTETHYTRDAQGNVMGTYLLGLNHVGRMEYMLNEHHIYGSSRLGMQSYAYYKAPKNYHRVVGDKRYELSNHLGNVLNVINDRKLVQSKVKVIHTNFFDEYPWNPHLHAKIGITQGRMLDVIPLEDGAGAEMKIKLEGGLQHIFQIDVVRDSIPSNIPLLFAVRDVNMNILVSQEINESKFVYQQFTPSVTADYFITVTQNTAVNPVQSFYLDNFYIYALPASGQDFVSLFLPDVLSHNDYYPFGMQVPNRFASLDDYRYGFNGMEKDDEIKGEGNSYDYGARFYDPRVGRWLSVDPRWKELVSYSPYSFSYNNPNIFIDKDGEFPILFFLFFKGVEFVRENYTSKPAAISYVNSKELSESQKKNTLYNLGLKDGLLSTIDLSGNIKDQINDIKNVLSGPNTLMVTGLNPRNLEGLSQVFEGAKALSPEYQTAQVISLIENWDEFDDYDKGQIRGIIYGTAVQIVIGGTKGARIKVPKLQRNLTRNFKVKWKELSKNYVKIDDKRSKHIFRQEEGHFNKDTKANRRTLEEVANKKETYSGTDKYGNDWHSEILENGNQIWVQSRNGKIINGGKNITPKPFNQDTGYSSPNK